MAKMVVTAWMAWIRYYEDKPFYASRTRLDKRSVVPKEKGYFEQFYHKRDSFNLEGYVFYKLKGG